MTAEAAPQTRNRPAEPRDRRRTAVRVVGVLALAALVGCFISMWAERHFWHGAFDLNVYRGAMIWWQRDGQPLYEFRLGHTVYGYTYPPFAAVLMLPMAWVSAVTAQVITAVGCVVAIVVTTWWLLAPIARRHGWSPAWAVAVAAPLVVALDPVRETVGYLQVNLFLAALVLADVIALRRGWRWAGVGTGVATAIKLTPGLFVLYFLLTRRWRAAATSAATFVVASLVAFLFDPHTSVQFWGTAVFQTNRVGRPDYTENQSLMGLLARLALPGKPSGVLWGVLVLALLVFGMWRAVQAFRRGDELVGITLTGLTGNLISPISWTHHLYWVVPALIVLLDVAVGTPVHPASRPQWLTRPGKAALTARVIGLVTAVTFVLGVPWYWKNYEHTHIHAHGLGILGENSFVLLLVLLVLVLPVRSPDALGPEERSRQAVEAAAG